MASYNKPFFRHRASGVTRIVRDTYGSKSDWFALCKEIKIRDGHKCIFCGKPEQPKLKIFHDVHHLIRLADGGTTTKANLGLCCDACHARRPKHGHMKVNVNKGVGIQINNRSMFTSFIAAPAPKSKFSNWQK